MWAGLFVMGALAQGIPEMEAEAPTEAPVEEAEPEPVAESGTLQVVAVTGEVDSWAQSLWEAAVKKANRQWRRASRKSDEPIPPPEVPEPEPAGVHEVLVVVSSADGAWEVLTDADGAVSLALPAGAYRVEVNPQNGPAKTVEGVMVEAGKTRKLVVTVEEWAETDVVTWLPPEPQSLAVLTRPTPR